MNNPFERFECWHPRCAHYAPLGIKLTRGELRQTADDSNSCVYRGRPHAQISSSCVYCGRPVRPAQTSFLAAVWRWIFE